MSTLRAHTAQIRAHKISLIHPSRLLMKSAGMKTGTVEDGGCNSVRSLQSGIEDGVDSRSNLLNRQHCILDAERSSQCRFRGIITSQRKFQGKWEPELEVLDVTLSRHFPSQPPPCYVSVQVRVGPNRHD
jgi:hypothetical protein